MVIIAASISNRPAATKRGLRITVGLAGKTCAKPLAAFLEQLRQQGLAPFQSPGAGHPLKTFLTDYLCTKTHPLHDGIMQAQSVTA